MQSQSSHIMMAYPKGITVRFSERYGYKTVREIIQIDSINEQLRNSLWSLLKIHIWDNVEYNRYSGGFFLSNNREIKTLCERLWFDYYKRPLDTLVNDWVKVSRSLREYFFGCEWYEVYDFVEFIANNYPYPKDFKDQFIQSCNAALEKEVSAYRFVNGLITRITAQEEIDEIDLALEKSRDPVRTHLRRALELLSDRKAPDYRNSIKESISAVESLVAIVVGEKGTLGPLIKKLKEIGIHPALLTAFSNLYGYTSDEDGIRHAIMDSEKILFEDAKFFLVVCSAFVNFVESKVAALG